MLTLHLQSGGGVSMSQEKPLLSPDNGWPTSLQQDALIQTSPCRGRLPNGTRHQQGQVALHPVALYCTRDPSTVQAAAIDKPQAALPDSCGMQQSMPTSLPLHMGAS